jgi:hypothetical protein
MTTTPTPKKLVGKPLPPPVLPPLSHKLITLDLDATLFDPWHCCGGDHFSVLQPGCLHLRTDTLTRVREIQAANPGTALVALSYRHETKTTALWLPQVGIEVEAMFLMGGADTRALLPKHLPLELSKVPGFGQVAHKLRVVLALIAAGHEIVASFDDNEGVCDALRPFVGEAVQVPYLVKVEWWEKAAGRLGVPKPESVIWTKDSVIFARQEALSRAHEPRGSMIARLRERQEAADVSHLLRPETNRRLEGWTWSEEDQFFNDLIGDA